MSGSAANETSVDSVVSDDSRLEELRRFVAPLSKEQLIDLVANAAIRHQDVYVKCTESVASSPAARRLMVRNILFSTRDESFVALFRQYGEIEDGLIVREKDGRSRGYGFVTFKYLESVRSCLDCTHCLDGKELFVKLAADPFTDADQRKLFVRNLADVTDSEGLRAVFSQFGNLEECVVVSDSQGKSRGYGFITYTNASDAFKAVQQCERVIDGRVAFIHFASPQSSKKTVNEGRGGSNRGNYFRGDRRGGGGDGTYSGGVRGGGGRGNGPTNFRGNLPGNFVGTQTAASPINPYGYPYPYAPGMYPGMPQAFPMAAYPAAALGPNAEYLQGAGMGGNINRY